MKYQKSPIEGEDTRYRIVPQTDSVDETQPDSNLNDILILMTNGCPIKKSCIAIDGSNMICSCNYLGHYPFGKNDKHQLDTLLCKYDNGSRTLKVSLLKVRDCPQHNNTCIATKNGLCRHLKTVNIPWDLSKPHARVACSQM